MVKSNALLKEVAANQRRHWVRITRACNNKCLFCLDQENQNGLVFSMKEILFDLKRGLDSGIKRVVISGGDPTVHPKLDKIIKKAKQLGYEHVQIITNGRMLVYEKFAKKLKLAGLDEVTLSLHSHIESDFEKMTGIRGSYKQALGGLLNAQKYGFIVSVDIVINKINYKKLKETLQFYMKMGVTEFDLLYPIPFGSAWKNRKELFFSPKKAEKFLQAAFALSKSDKVFIWTNRLPAQYLEGYENLIQNPIKMRDEVNGMLGELLLKIRNGQELSCRGEKCKYCFMQNFCLDLDFLLKKKSLQGKQQPPCFNLKNDYNINPHTFFLDGNLDPFVFLDFYLKNRYFVKSLRCKKCVHDKKCQGAWIETVRKKGFKIMKNCLK